MHTINKQRDRKKVNESEWKTEKGQGEKKTISDM